MGAMAPYFQVLPVPAAGLPTNAALVVSQYLTWSVKVLDGATELATSTEGIQVFGALGASYALVRPARGWPPDRELQIVATIEGGAPVRAVVRSASGPSRELPRCDWTGPVGPAPRGPSIGEGGWPTNVPRPPSNQRSFSLPRVTSAAGYLVLARVLLEDGKQRGWVSGALRPGDSVDVPLTPLPPKGELSDRARIVGLELEDVAGGKARYGAS